MALELIGTLTNVLPEQSGQGKNGTWVKQEFVIETHDTYPKKICITAWGNQTNELKQFAIGDVLKASVNIESREYNGKWYTDIKAWRIELSSGGAAAEASQPSSQPAASAPSRRLPEPPPLTNFEEGDDLPF
jgi:Domain of unknown function (DUF3127)